MLNKRIVIFGGLLIAVICGGAVAAYLRSTSLDRQALACRQRGLEAWRDGDHLKTLDQVGRYLQRFGQDQDAEALLAYAKARRHVPMPNAKHLVHSASLLRRAIEIDPENVQAEHELLDVYLALGYGNETFALASQILDRRPDDTAALRARAIMQARQRQFAEALQGVARIAELNPEDLDNHLFALYLLQQSAASHDQIRAYAAGLFNGRAADARYQLVQSVVHELTGDRAQAIRSAQAAVQQATTDPRLVERLDAQLNRLGLFTTSMDLLQRSAAASAGESSLRAALIHRLWQAGQPQAVLQAIAAMAPAQRDVDMLALQAMALAQSGQADEANRTVEALETRQGDTAAAAWAPVLRAFWLTGQTAPADALAACRAALDHQPTSPYFHYFQGLAYQRLGEGELAVTAWRQASRYAPAWAEPVIQSAGHLAASGNKAAALSLAQQGIARAPENVNVAIAAAQILGQAIDDLSAEGQSRLLDLVTRIYTVRPLEPRTLPILIDVLARRTGRDAAGEKLSIILATPHALPEALLLRLAEVSGRHGLGLEQACYDRVTKESGLTPGVAYARAVAAHKSGDTETGRQLLAEAVKSHGDALEWRTTKASYLALIGAPEAVTAWYDLADAHPDNLALQQIVLNFEPAWSDPVRLGNVVERVRRLTGEEALAWRLAKARWLLVTDRSERAAAEAAVLANDVLRNSSSAVQPHLILAAALERLRNVEGAIESLSTAMRLAPDSRPIRFDLARLYQRRGNTVRAGQILDELQGVRDLNTEETRRLAALLARQGQTDRAIALILQTYPPGDRQAPPDLLLANLYRRQNQFARAQAICNRLLEQETSVVVVEFLADLLAAEGRVDEARKVLARLDEVQMQPAIRKLLLAEFERQHGEPEATLSLYSQAVQADGDNASIWRAYLAYLVRAGRGEQAGQALKQAQAACPDERLFGELSTRYPQLASSASLPMAQALILAAIEIPDRQPEAITTLDTLLDSQQRNETPEALTVRLRQLAQRYPQFLPLQMLLVRSYAAIGRHDAAATVATQAMQAFPDSVEPAWMAAEALAASGQWVEALSVAREWRRRSINRPLAADLMIAAAQVRLNRAQDALETIQPYMDEADKDPAVFSPILVRRAQALIIAGRIDEAAQLIEPRLSASDQWRMAWVRMAAVDISAAATASGWLERVEPLIPAHSVNERVALASGWYTIAERADEASYRGRARAILEALAQRPGVTADVILPLALVADRDGDHAAAEASYRLALRLNPDLPVAKNNLAMILITRRQDLDGALKLALEAAGAVPTEPHFQDTVAHAYAELGDFDAALAAATRATELQPREKKWRDRLRQLQARQSESADARPLTPS